MDTRAKIIGFAGAPGVGKTYLAEKLSKKLGIYFLKREILLDAVFGTDRESEYYRHLTGPLTESTWAIAIENAKRGCSSILESPMTEVIRGEKAPYFERNLSASKLYGFDLLLVYCGAPGAAVLKNLKKRGSP